MADITAPLQTLIGITGTLEAPGAADNPVILDWAHVIARRFPKMLEYCALYKHDETPWCGLTQAYAMAVNGIEPPFGPEDVDRFLYVDAWEKFGTLVAKEDARPGDILIFRGGGMHHVSMLDHVDGDNFAARGGNQGDSVKVSTYPKSACTMVRRPPAPASIPMAVDTSIKISKANNFAACVAIVLKEEGGNDDDPRDPGGRTSRGILQKEWDVYRRSRPGLPSDVWQAPQADIEAIYHQSYWDVVWGDELPPGVDLAVFDMAVLQGVGRVTDLQSIVGTEVDGEMGPNTIAAVKRYIDTNGVANLINAIGEARMTRLRGSKNWGTYGKGWTNRINEIRRQAAVMALLPMQPQEKPVTDAPPTSPAPVPAAPTPLPKDIDVGKLLTSLSEDVPQIMARIKAMETAISKLASIYGQLQSSGVLDKLAQAGASIGLPKINIPILPPIDPVTANPVTAAPTAAVDAHNKTGLGAGIIGLITALGLGAAGVTGTPMGEAATTTGQVLPLLAGGVSLLGAFGKLAPFLRAAIAIL